MSENPPEVTPDDDTRDGAGINPIPDGGDSGRFAVFSPELGNYVSGVTSKADASKAAKAMKADKDAVTYGHKLTVVEV